MSGVESARRINPGYGSPTFSRIEVRDILIAVAVLSVSLTIIFRRNMIFSNDVVVNTLCWLITSFILIVLSFMLHEMGHKFTAQRYGAWSEFRMYPMGLVLCLVMSLVGFLFAAPGAVYIRGRITDEMNGKISAAGPIVNIVISALSLALMYAVSNGLSRSIFFLLAYMNAFLALFNLLPIPPLDGSKVVKWSLPVYVCMLAASGALLLITYL